MGHSLNVLGLRSGISYKWKIFFISSHLVNYYYDHTVFFYFFYKYLVYLFRYKYRSVFRSVGIAFSHLIMSVNNYILIKIFLYNGLWYKIRDKFYYFFLNRRFKGIFYKRRKFNFKLLRLSLRIKNRRLLISRKIKKYLYQYRLYHKFFKSRYKYYIKRQWIDKKALEANKKFNMVFYSNPFFFSFKYKKKMKRLLKKQLLKIKRRERNNKKLVIFKYDKKSLKKQKYGKKSLSRKYNNKYDKKSIKQKYNNKYKKKSIKQKYNNKYKKKSLNVNHLKKLNKLLDIVVHKKKRFDQDNTFPYIFINKFFSVNKSLLFLYKLLYSRGNMDIVKIYKFYKITARRLRAARRFKFLKKKGISFDSFFRKLDKFKAISSDKVIDLFFRLKVFIIFFSKIFCFSDKGFVVLNFSFFKFLFFLFFKKNKKNYRRLLLDVLKVIERNKDFSSLSLDNFYYYFFFSFVNLYYLNGDTIEDFNLFFSKLIFFLYKIFFEYVSVRLKYLLTRKFYSYLSNSFYNFFKFKMLFSCLSLYKNVELISKKIKLIIFPLNEYTFSPLLLLNFWKWKLKKKFSIYSLIYGFKRTNLSKNFMLKGFSFKGFGRFTRRQRAMAVKKSFGKIGYSTFSLSLGYFFFTIRTKYGLCSLRIWYNINKEKVYKKYNKNTFYLNLL